MIQYARSLDNTAPMEVSDQLLTDSWVRIEKPNAKEVDYVADTFGLDDAVIRDALDPHEIPRLELSDGLIYFITRLPDTDDDFNDFTTPIMFVVHPEHVLTISRDSLSRLWQPFIKQAQINTSSSVQTLVAMFTALVAEYQHKVTAINRQMRAASTDVTKLRSKDIATFVEYERKLNDYLDALVPSNDALQSLLNGKTMKMDEADRSIAEDISISFEQIVSRCKSLLRTITNVRDSYRAVMDTRLNETIRLLTVITLALTIPMMLSGLYGMNVELPGNEQSPAAFWIIATFAIGTSAVMTFYFLYKRR